MDLLATGRIEGTHGLGGFLRLRSYSGEVDHLLKLTSVEARRSDGPPVRLVVDEVRPASKGVLIRFRGYDTVDKARELVRAELWVQRGKACPLGPDEFYLTDLLGCTVVVGERAVGKVRSVWDGAAALILEVETSAGKLCSIPFVKVHVGEVDIDKGRIELLSEWLLE